MVVMCGVVKGGELLEEARGARMLRQTLGKKSLIWR
jgi:hypothetical protein